MKAPVHIRGVAWVLIGVSLAAALAGLIAWRVREESSEREREEALEKPVAVPRRVGRDAAVVLSGASCP